jgi:hypothetical protein
MGDVTSGGVQDDATANTDLGGGQDTSPSYSDLGQSPGAMGGSAPATPSYGMSPGAMGGRIPGVVPDVKPSIYGRSFDPGVYSQPETSIVPSFDGPFGSGASTNAAVRELQRFARGIASLSGTTAPDTSDDGPSQISASPVTASIPTVQGPAPDIIGFEPKGGTGVSPETVISRRGMPDQPTYVSPNVVKEFLGGDYDVVDRFAPRGMGMETRSNLFPSQLGGGELTVTPQGFQNIISPQQEYPAELGDNLVEPLRMTRADPTFVFDYGFSPSTTKDVAPMGTGLGLADSPALARTIANLTTKQDTLPSQIGDNLEANKIFSLGKGTTKPKTQEDLNILQRLGRFLKGVGKSISNFEMNDIFEFLRGDPNYKGPSPAQQDLMGVPGPGPEVGGGVPSPSGTGGGTGTDMPVTTMPETPAETVIKKDPCPPGFKLDPILNQCMPIVKAAPTPPPMPTLPQPTAPTGGGIANVYPFTLTPPVGAPVGTVAPIRFTPK